MGKLELTKAEKISLKNHKDFNEKWLQDIVQDDTSIIGLGDLTLIERERRQEKAGRLDFLLADAEDNIRYEVELMLGGTDESHIIRCIEYWDIERRRYPGYEHIAVLIAEDITSRFLNVLSLLSGTIPMIAIQVNALQVGQQIVLDFVKVLDQSLLRTDDTSVEASPTVNREFYETKRSTPSMVKHADSLLKVINSKSKWEYSFHFVKAYMGIKEGSAVRNFVLFQPRKKHFRLSVQIANKKAWDDRFDEAGISFTHSRRYFRAILRPTDFKKHQALIEELLLKGVEEFEA